MGNSIDNSAPRRYNWSAGLQTEHARYVRLTRVEQQNDGSKYLLYLSALFRSRIRKQASRQSRD